jgi:hypothetical protein
MCANRSGDARGTGLATKRYKRVQAGLQEPGSTIHAFTGSQSRSPTPDILHCTDRGPPSNRIVRPISDFRTRYPACRCLSAAHWEDRSIRKLLRMPRPLNGRLRRAFKCREDDIARALPHLLHRCACRERVGDHVAQPSGRSGETRRQQVIRTQTVEDLAQLVEWGSCYTPESCRLRKSWRAVSDRRT